MAFNKAPSGWLGAGYGLSSHAISLNTNDAASNKTLPQLTDALADPTTGDIRNVSFALVEKLYQAWVAAGVDVPAKMVITRTAAALAGGYVQYQYQFRFTVSPPAGAYSIPAE